MIAGWSTVAFLEVDIILISKFFFEIIPLNSGRHSKKPAFDPRKCKTIFFLSLILELIRLINCFVPPPLYKSFIKLNYSQSYSYFLLFLSLSFLIFSLPLRSKTVFLQFLLLLILSCAVAIELLPSDILTRLINYGALFIALDILAVLKFYNKSLIGQLMMVVNFFIAITIPWFILDRVEYQIHFWSKHEAIGSRKDSEH